MPQDGTSSTRLNVAVIGAGLGGLLLALFLEKHAVDLKVDIYESASQLTEIGAGVGMWPRMWEIMKYLGLDEELMAVCGGNKGAVLPVYLCKADEVEQVEIMEMPPTLFTFHRAVLQGVLARNLAGSININFAKRLVGFREPVLANDSIVMQFKDGTTAQCDLLIGSDGIRSAVRRSMFTMLSDEAADQGRHAGARALRLMIEPVWSGQVAFRGLIRKSDLLPGEYEEKSIFLLGKDKHIIAYPISRGEQVNVAAFINYPGREGSTFEGPWVSATTPEHIAGQFASWAPSVPVLLQKMEKPLCWAVHTVPPLPTFINHRAVLIGDAAHAMTPHQGAGAGQALEDGFILGTILANPKVTLSTLGRALKVYDTLRRPFAQDIQQRSRMNGLLYELNTLGWERVSAEESAAGGFPAERLAEIGAALRKQFEWSLNTSIMQDRDQAVEMMEKLFA